MKHLFKTTLLLLTILLPTLAASHDFEVDGIYYNINGNEATVTYRESNSSNFNSYSGTVIIPKNVTYNGTTYSVTSIGDWAFSGSNGLMSVEIPNTVTSIGYSVFNDCTSLTSIEIPNSVTTIGGYTFEGTPWYDSQPNGLVYAGLVAYGYKGTMPDDTSITLNEGTLGIADEAFENCTNLISIEIPNSVKYVGRYSFSYCSNLTNIVIPNSVTNVGVNAFDGTAWYNSQPDGLVYVGQVAYKYKGTVPDSTNITLRDGTLSIADCAFSGCTDLTSIEVPSSVRYIGSGAFYGCTDLTDINIPDSVISIGSSAFYNCTSLTSIKIPNYVTSIERCTFEFCSNLANVEIGNSVTSIGDLAFWYCRNLTSIEIPNSVFFIGQQAFDHCSRLSSINIANSVTIIRQSAFFGTPWFNNQPNGLVYAGLVAYGYKGTMPDSTSITLREGTLGIAGAAFCGCSGLTSIEIPGSVINIGDQALSRCHNLASIIVASDNHQYDSRGNCNAIIETASNTLVAGCKNTIIPNSIRSIGDFAFYDSSGLIHLDMPFSITAIGRYAFHMCTGLTNIQLPNSVTNIGEYAYNGCSSVQDVYCYIANPPICEYNTFTNYSATLHVPATSLAAYFTAPYWGNFENIVGDAVVPTGISISRDSIEANIGEQFELIATVTPENASNKVVSWYSTDTTVAIVDNGIVTTVGYGECDIYAYCFGMPAICHVSVTQRISLDQQEAMLLPNHILSLTPSALPMPERFTVASSDPTVAAARVMNGKVQIVGVAEGTATITVGSADGLAVPATCLVTVYTEIGDVNMDGFVNISDVTRTINYVLSGNDTGLKFFNADLNGDGRVTINDVTALINRVLTTTE